MKTLPLGIENKFMWIYFIFFIFIDYQAAVYGNKLMSRSFYLKGCVNLRFYMNHFSPLIPSWLSTVLLSMYFLKCKHMVLKIIMFVFLVHSLKQFPVCWQVSEQRPALSGNYLAIWSCSQKIKTDEQTDEQWRKTSTKVYLHSSVIIEISKQETVIIL